ncbi:hypothetical protein [Streptomyces graminilatus]|uniref:hypothetical protein n=1 Tax=Streptomyces graminilatus TaxID=1464070 RepID=UPI0006E1BAB2|nr:hypothetical protein [Streptomyces graminilatus]
MPPIPDTVLVHRSRLALTALYALLYALLFAMPVCLGDQPHASEQPYGRSAAAPSEVQPRAKSPDSKVLDAPDSPDSCHDAGSEAATTSKSSTTPVRPSATTAVSRAGDGSDLLSHDSRDATRRLPPSGGRSALVRLCQWRV